MNVVIVYESLTGNTEEAAERIGSELLAAGCGVAVYPIGKIDLGDLAAADLVIVGSWVDGLMLFGQRPGRVGRLRRMPVIDGKRAAVFCTYAIDPGRTLSKLSDVVSERGGDVVGGMALHRGELAEGARDFTQSLLAAVNA